MLLLVRHGESEWNAEHRLQGQADPGLSARGRAQALELAPLVARYAPVRAVTSDLRRAVATAELLGHPDATPDARWREHHMGDWQGRLSRDVDRDAFQAWRAGERAAPNGESFPAFDARVREAALELLALDGPTLVVCHGGAIRTALSILLGVRRSAVAPSGNCSLSVVGHGPRGPRLVAYNLGVDGSAGVQEAV